MEYNRRAGAANHGTFWSGSSAKSKFLVTLVWVWACRDGSGVVYGKVVGEEICRVPRVDWHEVPRRRQGKEIRQRDVPETRVEGVCVGIARCRNMPQTKVVLDERQETSKVVDVREHLTRLPRRYRSGHIPR